MIAAKGNIIMRIMPNYISIQINYAAASRGSAGARNFFNLFREVVVHRQLLALLDPAPADIENVTLEDRRPQVRLARVIDVFRPTAPHCAVQRPVVIQHEQVRMGAEPAPPRLPPSDPLARVFDDLPAGRNSLGRVDAV